MENNHGIGNYRLCPLELCPHGAHGGPGKGRAYEHIPALPHSDEVKAINPLGLVPGMRHDGLDLVESHAITQYIDTAFDGPALVPTDP